MKLSMASRIVILQSRITFHHLVLYQNVFVFFLGGGGGGAQKKSLEKPGEQSETISG
jgi:hypothetical protein